MTCNHPFKVMTHIFGEVFKAISVFTFDIIVEVGKEALLDFSLTNG